MASCSPAARRSSPSAARRRSWRRWGRASPPAGLGPLPANVHTPQWLNHGELLPRCSALVTVGGKATILAAMEAGVPLVLVPTTWDKPDNARRVTEAGAGLR